MILTNVFLSTQFAKHFNLRLIRFSNYDLYIFRPSEKYLEQCDKLNDEEVGEKCMT